MPRNEEIRNEDVNPMGCTYSKIHSRRKDCPLVKERMQGQCKEAVADGRGSRKAELCAATRITPSSRFSAHAHTCLFSHSPIRLGRSQLDCATTKISSLTSLCSGQCRGHQGVINTCGCARLLTMNLEHRGAEISCLQATP
jgi:hypothetical protein